VDSNIVNAGKRGKKRNTERLKGQRFKHLKGVLCPRAPEKGKEEGEDFPGSCSLGEWATIFPYLGEGGENPLTDAGRKRRGKA